MALPDSVRNGAKQSSLRRLRKLVCGDFAHAVGRSAAPLHTLRNVFDAVRYSDCVLTRSLLKQREGSFAKRGDGDYSSERSEQVPMSAHIHIRPW